MFDVAALAVDFQIWKQWMVDSTGLTKDALHIYFGLMVFLCVRLVWRWRFGWTLAWLVTLAFTLGGEWLDLHSIAALEMLQPDAEHWHDVWNTMLWPTVLLLIGRWLEPRRSAKATEIAETPSGEDAEQPLEQA